MDKPEIGYGIRVIVEALLKHVSKITGLYCEHQPTPIGLRETGLIFVPEGFEVKEVELTKVDGYVRATVALKFTVILTGEGDGGNEFLAETLEASLKTALAFREPLVVPVFGEHGDFSVVFIATPTAKGRYFAVEEEKGFVYEAIWSGELIFPITVENKTTINLSATGWIKEIKVGGA